MSTEETVRKGYTELGALVSKLLDISREQQTQIQAGDLSGLSESFEKRVALLSELQSKKMTLDKLLNEAPSSAESPGIQAAKKHFQELGAQFLHLDTLLSQLLEVKAKGLATDLIRRFQKQSGAESYHQVERNTDLVARIFEGNSRRFNESL